MPAYQADSFRTGDRVQCQYSEPAVVALMRGGAGPGPTVAFRADMDGLPILEKNSIPYKSSVPGVMHASGHDAHMAILLGLAHLLKPRLETMRGNVKLIFQPGEETPHPGGAFQLIQEGVLLNPKVDYLFAHHLHFALTSDSVCVPSGISMATTDDFELLVEGRCSPIAQPQAGVDAIVIAAQIVAFRTNAHQPHDFADGKRAVNHWSDSRRKQIQHDCRYRYDDRNPAGDG